jgi:hypothetical protein
MAKPPAACPAGKSGTRIKRIGQASFRAAFRLRLPDPRRPGGRACGALAARSGRPGLRPRSRPTGRGCRQRRESGLPRPGNCGPGCPRSRCRPAAALPRLPGSSRSRPADARRGWQHFSDPELWPQERLFFELYTHALLGRPGTEGFLKTAVEPWITYIAARLAEAGADEATARADARLAVAITRGLLLDLLATGDREGGTEAFERYLQYAEAYQRYLQDAEPQHTPPAEQPAQPHSDP